MSFRPASQPRVERPIRPWPLGYEERENEELLRSWVAAHPFEAVQYSIDWAQNNAAQPGTWSPGSRPRTVVLKEQLRATPALKQALLDAGYELLERPDDSTYVVVFWTKEQPEAP